MKTFKFKNDNEGWMNIRLGKSTGSRAKDMLPGRDGGIKKGWWELVAERLIGSAAIDDEEKAMDRGTRLEPEAIARFAKETGKKLDSFLLEKENKVIWARDDDESIAVSPDAIIGKTAAVEAKCLNAASHIEARVTGKIPKNTAGYEEQATQYFCVNDNLKTLYFVFYDPRFPTGLDFFYIEIKRKDRKEAIASQLQGQRDALKFVRETVNKLTFYSPAELKKAEVVKEELVSGHKASLERVYASIKSRV